MAGVWRRKWRDSQDRFLEGSILSTSLKAERKPELVLLGTSWDVWCSV